MPLTALDATRWTCSHGHEHCLQSDHLPVYDCRGMSIDGTHRARGQRNAQTVPQLLQHIARWCDRVEMEMVRDDARRGAALRDINTASIEDEAYSISVPAADYQRFTFRMADGISTAANTFRPWIEMSNEEQHRREQEHRLAVLEAARAAENRQREENRQARRNAMRVEMMGRQEEQLNRLRERLMAAPIDPFADDEEVDEQPQREQAPPIWLSRDDAVAQAIPNGIIRHRYTGNRYEVLNPDEVYRLRDDTSVRLHRFQVRDLNGNREWEVVEYGRREPTPEPPGGYGFNHTRARLEVNVGDESEAESSGEDAFDATGAFNDLLESLEDSGWLPVGTMSDGDGVQIVSDPTTIGSIRWEPMTFTSTVMPTTMPTSRMLFPPDQS